ncbi:MAG TPA: GDP-mannose 4,6-dehydratase [Flavobacterium sp.]|uniref:GDP-mannose 4,6-dehydratase n=1 Tax=Flavobacterium sp. TaxID=239 RepID=UPI002CBFDC07|nr:GDP-mannose 4,6-dehydratase [Flavobacterium sp.]HSD15416.1 GDP-mannose 4,6-dehydratase [Flavobacterium sp.]
MSKRAIISGISGQDGAYLAQLLLDKGYEVVGLLRENNHPDGLTGLEYLGIKDKIKFEYVNLLHIHEVENLFDKVQPDEFYNLAAQSSVFKSFKEPIQTFQFNTISVFNLLETIKNKHPEVKFYQASSSEMYGKVNNLPITENSVLHPLSPYAISKAAAHFTCIHYRESYGLHISCGVLFNHESYLRQEHFFVKKVIRESIKISKGEQQLLSVGNIDVKRDFGYAPKYVEVMYLMLQKEHPSDYLICSGKSVSLRDIIFYVFEKLKIDKSACKISDELYRPADIEDIYGNNTKAKSELNWDYDLSILDVLDLLIEEELKNQ